jgi:hypothetical protein
VKRETREAWAKRVERWRASGLTAAEFARRLGVSEKSLRWWKWQLGQPHDVAPRQAQKAKPPASPLTFVEMTAAVQREPFEVVLASGTRVRLPADFDATVLVRLLDVLERRR